VGEYENKDVFNRASSSDRDNQRQAPIVVSGEEDIISASVEYATLDWGHWRQQDKKKKSKRRRNNLFLQSRLQ